MASGPLRAVAIRVAVKVSRPVTAPTAIAGRSLDELGDQGDRAGDVTRAVKAVARGPGIGGSTPPNAPEITTRVVGTRTVSTFLTVWAPAI